MLLQLMGFTDKQIVDLKNKFKSFSNKEKAALTYALKINNSANKTTLDDHKILKEFGYNDKQIVEITSVVAAFNWANIIADALGTDMES
jgi:alkylhydroperoxidase family enzyme